MQYIYENLQGHNLITTGRFTWTFAILALIAAR